MPLTIHRAPSCGVCLGHPRLYSDSYGFTQEAIGHGNVCMLWESFRKMGRALRSNASQDRSNESSVYLQLPSVVGNTQVPPATYLYTDASLPSIYQGPGVRMSVPKSWMSLNSPAQHTHRSTTNRQDTRTHQHTQIHTPSHIPIPQNHPTPTLSLVLEGP